MTSRNPTEAYGRTSGETLGNDRNDETLRQIGNEDSLNNRRARAPSSTNSHRDLITTEASDQEGRRQRRRLNTPPCCSCSRGSTCYRSTFGHGSQGCECRSTSRKCLPSCPCSKRCTNQHQPPTPGLSTPSIANFFGRGGNGDRTAALVCLPTEEEDLIPLPVGTQDSSPGDLSPMGNTQGSETADPPSNSDGNAVRNGNGNAVGRDLTANRVNAGSAGQGLSSTDDRGNGAPGAPNPTGGST